jgi:PIN domain nuclease of toxin-antitoxin system
VRILLDTAIWFQFVRRLPISATVESVLQEPTTRRYISSISSMEIVRKWRVGKLPCPNPVTWLDSALDGFAVLPVTEPIARQAALWDWDHKDPSDRLIAATAHVESVELWHTDTVLRGLSGFPQRYFKAPPL